MAAWSRRNNNGAEGGTFRSRLFIAREHVLGHPFILTILIYELAALLAHQEVQQQMYAIWFQQASVGKCE